MNPSSCFCSLLGAPWHFAGHDAWPHPPQPPHPVPPHPAARTPWRCQAPREPTPWRPWLGRSRSRWHRGWEGRRRDPSARSVESLFLVCLPFVFLGQTFQVKCFGWWKYRWSLKRKGKTQGEKQKLKSGFLWHQRHEFAVYGQIIQVKSKLQMPTEIFNPI